MIVALNCRMDLRFSETVIEKTHVSTLAWHGDMLVDWTSGWRSSLNGEVQEDEYRFGFRFDAAIGSPSGRYAAVFERLGTKGLLLDRGKITRELNRSYYHSDKYEYPIAFVAPPGREEMLIHCPRDYNRIDIESAETGRCLTDLPGRKPADVFHSRLTASPGGAWLASAGWLWHPWDCAGAWSIEGILDNPYLLDESSALPFGDEVHSVAFLSDQRLIAWVSVDDDALRTTAEKLFVLDPASRTILSDCRLSQAPGTLVPFGTDLVLCLMEHPRLVRVSDGSIVFEWPHLNTGTQGSSFILHSSLPPAFAKHPTRPIFAVADGEKVTLVQLEGNLI